MSRRAGPPPAPPGVLSRPPQSILFACTFNTIRSPIAEALARRRAGSRLYVASAGLRAGEPDAFAIAVMDEIGLDISRHRPQTFQDLEDTNFDMIVTLSPEAHHTALEFTRSFAVEVIYWPTLEPTAVQGSRDTILAAYRGVRESLDTRIEELLEWRPIGNE